MGVVHINKADALAALHVQSWTTEEGRVIVHTFMGCIGADWDLEDALQAVETAREVGWAKHLLSHELVVRTDQDKIVSFDVRAPLGVLS